jgi:hypothetical protein
VQTVVIGDIRDIRSSADYGKKANQKIHQMLHGQTRQMLTYKAEKLGMKIELQLWSAIPLKPVPSAASDINQKTASINAVAAFGSTGMELGQSIFAKSIWDSCKSP